VSGKLQFAAGAGLRDKLKFDGLFPVNSCLNCSSLSKGRSEPAVIVSGKTDSISIFVGALDRRKELFGDFIRRVCFQPPQSAFLPAELSLWPPQVSLLMNESPRLKN
jgi:hypothetical protein